MVLSRRRPQQVQPVNFSGHSENPVRFTEVIAIVPIRIHSKAIAFPYKFVQRTIEQEEEYTDEFQLARFPSDFFYFYRHVSI